MIEEGNKLKPLNTGRNHGIPPAVNQLHIPKAPLVTSDQVTTTIQTPN
jgi:hypothetical protein